MVAIKNPNNMLDNGWGDYAMFDHMEAVSMSYALAHAWPTKHSLAVDIIKVTTMHIVLSELSWGRNVPNHEKQDIPEYNTMNERVGIYSQAVRNAQYAMNRNKPASYGDLDVEL